jgi:flagellar FliL protein
MAEEVKEGAEQEEKKGKKGGKKKLILFLLIGILVLGIAGGVVMFLGGKKGEKGKEKEKKPEKTFFVTLDPIVINLMDPTGKRYLQIQISLEVGDKKMEDEIKEKEPIIKDIIISVIGEKTVDDVLAPNAKEEIKKELKEKINQALGEDVILNIYILQYIVE